MAKRVLNCCGLKSPHPILKLCSQYPLLNDGDIVEIIGDCPNLKRDITVWCKRLGKRLIKTEKEGKTIRLTLRI